MYRRPSEVYRWSIYTCITAGLTAGANPSDLPCMLHGHHQRDEPRAAHPQLAGREFGAAQGVLLMLQARFGIFAVQGMHFSCLSGGSACLCRDNGVSLRPAWLCVC